MPAHIINEGIVSGGMFIAIGESIIARVAALGGYISFSLTACLKTPYEQVRPLYVKADVPDGRSTLHTHVIYVHSRGRGGWALDPLRLTSANRDIVRTAARAVCDSSACVNTYYV